MTNVIEDKGDLVKYNQDWTRKYRGHSPLVLRPKTAEQVANILKYCNERRLAVVPQGGNTGLVGGGVPVFDEIVMNMELMGKIHEFDPVSGVLQCEAGCNLEALDMWLRERGSMMPLDLGAKGSCQIGGNVATNAGGLRLLRYGSLHGSVMGLQSVLADGRILNGMNKCRKDNTGYDLKQLFIGSEGTLGVITDVSILTVPLPSSVQVALLAVPSLARKGLGEILSAFEFWDAASQSLLDQHFPSNPNPVRKDEAQFYVLLETNGSRTEHDQEKMMQLLEKMMAQGRRVLLEGTMAHDQTQQRQLWSLRENIPEACAREGIVYKYDVSLAQRAIYSPIVDLRGRLKDQTALKRIIGYGHFGDGNIHINVAIYDGDDAKNDIIGLVEPYIYQLVASQGGSISAEHGIGLMKANYLSFAKTPAEISIMKGIKDLFDPNGILNPYKVLP